MKSLKLVLATCNLLALSLACAPKVPAEGANSEKEDVGQAAAEDASAPYDPGIFTFSPKIGRTFQHTMHRRQEFSIIGAPIRNIEEWQVTWDIKIKKETNLSIFEAKLSELKVTVNDAVVLKGDEVKGSLAYMELLFDSKGRVVDIRRAETITQAILDLAAPESREALGNMFSRQNLRMLFLARANERIRDLVGHSARVDEVWKGSAAPEGEGPVTKSLTVQGIEDCGVDKCVRVTRDVTIDRKLVWEATKQRVADHVERQGGDPTLIKLTDAKVELEDEILVNPHNLEFHAASFSQKASLSVEGPKGPLSVSFSTLRESSYKY